MSDNESNKMWWHGLTRYHWFVFIAASLAWLFDCLDQQIFILSRENALSNLLPKDADGLAVATTVVKKYGGFATSIFMIGWATGGLIFGSVGDRIGRAKTLTLTVLIYSICTGLSALSRGWIDFAIFRFLTGLGVGGVFGLAVALVADSLPARSRAGALGMLQALSAVGNITAGLVGMLLGQLIAWKYLDGSNFWKVMFVVGALPAFLCVFLQIKLKEPEAWTKARQEGKVTGVKFGSYKSLFSDPRWLRHSIFGMMLCVAGVIGIWGIGFFSPELVRDVIKRNLAADGVDPSQIDGYAKFWVSINMICQNAGAFFGMLTFSYFAQGLGRRISFTVAFIAAMLATIGYFQLFNGIGHIWMSSVMGFFHLALFAGFAIYLPELFPISLRSTGTSFCYNAGRFIAATGPITLGKLQESLAAEGNSIASKASEAIKQATLQAENAATLADKTAALADKAAALAQQAIGNEMKLDAFRDACTYMSVVFLLGLVAVWFLPETKGKPLPE
ncbi:MAG: MFS transporter [Planctomycetota bacterium]|nr:MFS transporter [Planctomycetota bacterium]